MSISDEKWQFDALKLQLAFTEHLGIERPEWTDEDADGIEQQVYALMQATRQMNGGQRDDAKTDECGTLVSFDDVPTILNNVAAYATRLVLSGAHRKERPCRG